LHKRDADWLAHATGQPIIARGNESDSLPFLLSSIVIVSCFHLGLWQTLHDCHGESKMLYILPYIAFPHLPVIWYLFRKVDLMFIWFKALS